MSPEENSEVEPSPRRVRVVISGRVQGVCFRAYTQKEARRLGLAGWVRNCADGRVEAQFQGDAAVVEEMVTWCWKGSPYASVSGVDVTEEPAESDAPAAFRVEY